MARVNFVIDIQCLKHGAQNILWHKSIQCLKHGAETSLFCEQYTMFITWTSEYPVAQLDFIL